MDFGLSQGFRSLGSQESSEVREVATELLHAVIDIGPLFGQRRNQHGAAVQHREADRRPAFRSPLILAGAFCALEEWRLPGTCNPYDNLNPYSKTRNPKTPIRP